MRLTLSKAPVQSLNLKQYKKEYNKKEDDDHLFLSGLDKMKLVN